MSSVAVTDGVASPPPRSDVMPAPAPAARTATRRTSPAAPEAILPARSGGGGGVEADGHAPMWRVASWARRRRGPWRLNREPDGGVGGEAGAGCGDRAAVATGTSGWARTRRASASRRGLGKLKRTQFGWPASAARRAYPSSFRRGGRGVRCRCRIRGGTAGWCRLRSRRRSRRGGRPRPTRGRSAARTTIRRASSRAGCGWSGAEQQKKPLSPTRWARRWLAARSWTRLRRQSRSATSTPASAATSAAPSGPRTQWKGTGSPRCGVGSGRERRGRTAPRAACGLVVPR